MDGWTVGSKERIDRSEDDDLRFEGEAKNRCCSRQL